MASSKPLTLVLLVALSGHARRRTRLLQRPQACSNSKALFPNGWLLPSGKHESFDVCAWTGSVSAQGAAVAKFDIDHEGGAYYENVTKKSGGPPAIPCPPSPPPVVSTDQGSMPIRVSVTPHGTPLQGHCPTAGCDTGHHCFEHFVPGGNYHGVTEIKIVYYNP
uniref:Uncharacterized protein n=1 Tax=Aegilops tauschii TaxID=37682 RepID=M8BVX3_AEGTA